VGVSLVSSLVPEGRGVVQKLMAFSRRVVAALMLSTGVAGDVILATFDGAKGTTHSWKQQNDPVMGGKSTGTFAVSDGLGVFDGEVVNVPFLKAPGFIKASVVDMKPFGRIFPDISSCEAVTLTVRASNAYAGYRFSIGNAHAAGGKFFAYGYKSHFSPPVEKFGTVTIPLDNFTDYWDDATGEPIKTCQDNKDYCPSAKVLHDIRTMAVWAEGVAGKVHLEIKSVGATNCKAAVGAPGEVVLAAFDGSAKHSWHSENDPVMGGKSESKSEVVDGYLDYSGSCRVVPKLKAPGFTIALTESPLLAKFPDASAMSGLIVGVRNVGQSYSGFKVAFCDSRIGFTCQFKSYKADLVVATGSDFVDVFVPWKAFSNKWDAATGKHTAENPPTASSLRSITQLQLWTEGVEGDFHLQVKYIKAATADGEVHALLV